MTDDLLIVPYEPSSIDDRTFNAKIGETTLELPSHIVQVLAQLNIRNATTLMSYVFAFPSSFAMMLRWSIDEFTLQSAELVNLLRGRIPDKFLIGTPPLDVSFGALKP